MVSAPLLRFPLEEMPALPAQSEGASPWWPHTAPHKSGQLYPQNQAQRLGKAGRLLHLLRWVLAARDVEKGHCESCSAGSSQLSLPKRGWG